MTAILVEHVTKTYQRGMGRPVRALDDVSLAVEQGETLGIIGPNGAGKTTLLGCMLGFLKPDSGRVQVEGGAPDDLQVRTATGYLPERLVLDRWMTGVDFLHYHYDLAGLPAAVRREHCSDVLGRVGLEPAQGELRVGRYSRGMLQRLGLAQALLGKPRLLFLDEPISGVDPAGVLLFRKLLGDLSREGVTLVINSHQLAEVERVCSRVVFVKAGRIESIDTTRAGAGHARVLRVRLSSDAVWPAGVSLADVAAGAGAQFHEWIAPDARFSVADDAGATLLLTALLRAGLPVIEVSPEEGRLERLFHPGGSR